MSNYYNPDPDRFKVKRVTQEEQEEYDSLKMLAAKYVLVGIISMPVSLLMAIIKGRWGWALLMFLLGQVAIFLGVYYDLQARKVIDE
jgi:hypothetical protein